MESTGRHLNFVYNHQERSSPSTEIFNASSGSGFGPSQFSFYFSTGTSRFGSSDKRRLTD